MDDLVQFLRARLHEDAAIAGAAAPGLNYMLGAIEYAYDRVELDQQHALRHSPARVLAEVDAKRRIVELHEPVTLRAGGGAAYFDSTQVCRSCEPPKQFPETAYPCATIRLLALPFAGHPDYRDAWRP